MVLFRKSIPTHRNSGSFSISPSHLGESVNDGIDPEEFRIQYQGIHYLIELLRLLGPSTQFWKADVAEAFRTIPVHRTDWGMQGIFWLGFFFIDMYLPFGLRSAPFIFTSLMDLFVWICIQEHALINLRHFVDDFVYAAPPPDIHNSFDKFRALAILFGVPFKPSKFVPPTPIIEYVGFVLNAPNMTIDLPADKRERLRSTLLEWLNNDNNNHRYRARSYHDAHSLLGHLMHVVQILPDGKIFCDRLIRFVASWRPPSAGRRHISPGIAADLRWWIDTTDTWSGTHITTDLDWHDPHLFTDASGQIGAGGCLGSRWWRLRWAAAYRVNVHGIDIFWKEMFAIWVSLVLWGPYLRPYQQIILHTDSQPCIAALSNGRAPHQPRVNELIRLIVRLRLELGLQLQTRYVPTADNPADALSRLSSLPPRSLQEPLPSLVTSQFGFIIDTSTC